MKAGEEQEEVMDRKSDGTEGTDAEEPFSPSAISAKEVFDLDLEKCTSSPISHSPPEPISPSREQALKEDISPVYEISSSMKISVGVSPTDFIPEEPAFLGTQVIDEEEEEGQEDINKHHSVPKNVQSLAPQVEEPGKQTEEEITKVDHSKQDKPQPVVYSPVQEELPLDEPSSVPEPQELIHEIDEKKDMATVVAEDPPARVEFMSFDNMAFAGKDTIDDSQIKGVKSVQKDNDKPSEHTKDKESILGVEDVARQVTAEVVADAFSQLMAEEKDAYSQKEESVEKIFQEDESKVVTEIGTHGLLHSISSESSSEKFVEIEMEELQEQIRLIGTTQISAPFIEKDGEAENDDIIEPEESASTPTAEAPIHPPVVEPHEDINEAYDASVIDSITDRCVHDLDRLDTVMEMGGTGFRIGPIEYQEEEDKKKDIAEGYDACADHRSATRTVSSESSSDTMIASTMTASYMTAPTSLDTSTDQQLITEPSASVYETAPESFETKAELEPDSDSEHEETPDEEVHTSTKKPLEVVSSDTGEHQKELIHVDSDESIDRTESASLDSEELDEPYGDQTDEMVAEMQVHITPSPQPPRDGVSDSSKDSARVHEEPTIKFPPLIPELPKTIESISSEEVIKTSSSSDTSAEPTLLAATYDLESGVVSRVVAAYDISPDTVEKTLTVESHPKAILSSPEDEVFESVLMGDKAKDEDAPQEFKVEQCIEEEKEEEVCGAEAAASIEPERSSSPFEIVDEADLAGYYDFTVAQATSIEKSAPVAPSSSQVGDFEIGDPSQPPLPLEPEESPSFEHSSPISSSEPSDFRGPISPFDMPVMEPYPGVGQPTPAEPLERQHEDEAEIGQHLAEEEQPYIHANGPTEVDYLPEHDDILDEPPAYYAPPPPVGVDPLQPPALSLAEELGYVQAQPTEEEAEEEEKEEEEEEFLQPVRAHSEEDIEEDAFLQPVPEQQEEPMDIDAPEEEQERPSAPEPIEVPIEGFAPAGPSMEESLDSDTEIVSLSEVTESRVDVQHDFQECAEALLLEEREHKIIVDEREDTVVELVHEETTEKTGFDLMDSASSVSEVVSQTSVIEQKGDVKTETFKEVREQKIEESQIIQMESFEQHTLTDLVMLSEFSNEPPTTSLREELYVPEGEKLMESDTTLYNFEMPAEEISHSAYTDFTPEPQRKSSEKTDHVAIYDSEKEEDGEEESNIITEVPKEYVARSFHDNRHLESVPPSGRSALESDTMYTMFSGAVVTEVPPEFAQDSVTSPIKEEQAIIHEESGAQALIRKQSDDLPGEDEEPDEELMALAEDKDDHIPTRTDFSPLIAEDESRVSSGSYTDSQLKEIQASDEDKFDLRPDPMDIERPQSPVPDDSNRLWEEEDVMEEEEEQPPDEQEKEDDTVLHVRASAFVSSIMTEAKATITKDKIDVDEQEETEEESKEFRHEAELSSLEDLMPHVIPQAEEAEESKPEADITYEPPETERERSPELAEESLQPEDERDEMVPEDEQQFSPEPEAETEAQRQLSPEPEAEQELDRDLESSPEPEIDIPESEQAAAAETVEADDSISEEIPEIKITQHLHEETDEEDYPTSYAPKHYAEPLEEEMAEGVIPIEVHVVQELQEEEVGSEPEDDAAAASLPEDEQGREPFLVESLPAKMPEIIDTEPPTSQEALAEEALIMEIDEVVEKKQEAKESEEHDDVVDKEKLTIDDKDGESEKGSDEAASPVHSKAPSETGSDLTSTATVISIESAVQEREDVDLQSPEDLGDSSSVDSFATVVPLIHDTDTEVEDRLAEVASMTSSIHSDMQTSFHDEHPEPAITIDVRDQEQDVASPESMGESSSSSDKFEVIPKSDSDTDTDAHKGSPDEDKYDIVQQEEFEGLVSDTQPEYILIPRRELEVVKEESESDQQGTTSSSERLEVGTTSSSERIFSSPDLPTQSPDIHGGRFFARSGDRDDISVSSSLSEFERLEREVIDKSSNESFPPMPGIESPRPMFSKSAERDDVSISSSLAEFEKLEERLDDLGAPCSSEKIQFSSDSKVSADHGSMSSLNEFEKLEKEIQAESSDSKKSSDTNLDKNHFQSSTSSLSEFERLEQEMNVDEELEEEAQKVVTMLESGALMPDAEGSEQLDSPSRKEFGHKDLTSISQEQLMESMEASPVSALPQASAPPEEMDRDSLGEPEEPSKDIDEIIKEASMNVEKFEDDKPAPHTTEAVLISRQLQEVIRSSSCDSDGTQSGYVADQATGHSSGAEADIDSLDGRDDEEFKKDQALSSDAAHAESEDPPTIVEASSPVSPTMMPDISPIMQMPEDIDVDSLQESESQSRSGQLDSDSLQDQDSVMQISAESFEFDPVAPRMATAAEADVMTKSVDSGGVMERSADSLELDQQVPRTDDGIMERSADSLELEQRVPDSDSKDSFDHDSLHEQEGVMAVSADSLDLEAPRSKWPAGIMEMSTESGAWSCSSALSQDTIKSSDSGRDIMRISIESPEYEKPTMATIVESEKTIHEEYTTAQVFSTTTVDSYQKIEVRHTNTAYEDKPTIIDSEGNINIQPFATTIIDREGNVKPTIPDQEKMSSVREEILSEKRESHIELSEKHVASVDATQISHAPDPELGGKKQYSFRDQADGTQSFRSFQDPFPEPQITPSQGQIEISSPSSESSHSDNCYCGPENTSTMEAERRMDRRSLLTGGSTTTTNPNCVCHCMAACLHSFIPPLHPFFPLSLTLLTA